MNFAASFGVSIDRHQEDRHRGSHELLRPNCCDHWDISFCASRDVGLRYGLASFPSDGSSRPRHPASRRPASRHPGSGGDGDGAASSARAAIGSRAGAQRCDASKTSEDGTPATVIDDRDAEGILGKNVYSAANEDMGRVVDVIVKRTGEVRAAVIDFGGIPRRRQPHDRRRLERVALSNQRTDGPHHPGADPRPGQAGPRIQARRTSGGARLGRRTTPPGNSSS